ncbi:plasmid pRiA4b ORF-3 family protein [Lentilactobacillus sp. Marseille-Q4993]|uniref:plasmid pRiA4b ORF-3 family protein n=1 Tax=Lentilactobacillus sp. Marseille-Q4993 TaxID=3039492 RepID=UPI0024BD4549|nr:plasmid pRiA4b ORF-3 family protein [Lentilactobacillus sp. Marseille-Q4993]
MKTKVYMLQATLNDIEPVVDRTFLIPGAFKLNKLAYSMMVMFEMQASHLYSFDHKKEIDLDDPTLKEVPEKYRQFEINRRSQQLYQLPELDEDRQSDTLDPKKVTVDKVFDENDELNFTYDFGDDWTVGIKVLTTFDDPMVNSKDYPVVIHGNSYGIVEDIGGVAGLNQVLDDLKLLKGNDSFEYKYINHIPFSSFGSFDRDDINYRLKKIPRWYANVYEKGAKLTEKQIDFIMRY